MPSIAELKSKVCQEIYRRSEEIIGVANTILQNPEPGFRELKTSHLVAQKFVELGITYRDGIALTGVKGIVRGGNNGPTIAVLGELDSLIVSDHPKADLQTGAAHACGHHAQIGMLFAVAAALAKSEVLPFLNGNVALMAVPAEEYIEIEFRNTLRKEGKISFLGGKAELIKLGEFDDVDMAMMTHNTSVAAMKKLTVGGTNNGMVAKQIRFIGRSSHAGGAPHQGINALNAAMIALTAIHAQRETFRDDDTVRVHPIITKGGETVNIIPADVRMETYVRGKNLEAITDASNKVDRALRAGALAVGGRVQITTLPGYLPIINNSDLVDLYKINASALVGPEEMGQASHRTGSTDMGDVSQIMPVIHPYAGGAVGTSHGNDYLIKDYQTAVINPAKAMAMMVIDLLADGAAKAKKVINNSKPNMTRQKYVSLLESQIIEEEYDN
ncbi:MAG: amidohydrolase [Dehalococcoidales bacterium]|nr:amidohydrolase [Dehalococcoidales bacterium]